LLSDVSTTKLLEIVFNETIVKKKLENMGWNKVGGADNLFLRILSELSEEICHPVTVIMQASIDYA